jgi:hypothetical protein
MLWKPLALAHPAVKNSKLAIAAAKMHIYIKVM